MKEKEMEALGKEEAEKVSGGRIMTEKTTTNRNELWGNTPKLYKTEETVTQRVYCDKCGSSGAYPINGGALCEKCLIKYKEIIGKQLFQIFLNSKLKIIFERGN